MERKLATVLFVDIVDSTGLVTGTDPEVVRRRVNKFFEKVSHCVTIHGGIVEKLAATAREGDFKVLELEPLEPLERMVRLYRAPERNGDASVYEARLAELSPPPSSTARIA